MNDESKKSSPMSECATDLMKQVAAQNQQAFAAAKSAQLAAGKEPFDLDRLYEGWPWCPDFRNRTPEKGFLSSLEQRVREWENLYFVACPDVTTMAEFIEKMRETQLRGAFD